MSGAIETGECIVVFTQVPSDVTRSIALACKALDLVDAPTFVPIEPAEGARANQCVLNVATAVRNGRGREVLGWKVAEWPGVLVEFIGHSILETEAGVRLCITPDRHEETRVLFVPDPRLAFDPSDPEARMPSTLVPSTAHDDVAAFIRIENECRTIRQKLPPQSGLVHVRGLDAARLERLEVAQRRTIRDIALRTWPDSKLCVCDSGKSFSKCCKQGMRAEKRGVRAG
jgi:hypothetical protein